MRKLLLPLLMVCSGCNTVPRPDTDICVINAENMQRECFNMARDYDSEGNILPSAVPTFIPVRVLADLDKGIWIDSSMSWPNLKVYINELRQAAEKRK